VAKIFSLIVWANEGKSHAQIMRQVTEDSTLVKIFGSREYILSTLATNAGLPPLLFGKISRLVTAIARILR
jgi:hypothetical protein